MNIRGIAVVLVMVALANSASAQQGLVAPAGSIKERATKAEKVFLGTLVNRVEKDGRVDAQLRVDEPIKGVAKGELVKVHWLLIARYNAVENQKGLALLLPKLDDSYWLRADTFDDVKFANEARKAVGGPAASQPEQFAFGQPVNGLRLGLKAEVEFVAGRVTGKVVIENVSGKPVLMLSLLVRGATVFFELTDPDGAKVPYRGPMMDWDVPDYNVAVKELQPKETISTTLAVTGFTFDKQGKYTLTARYEWANARPPQGRRPAEWTRGPIWTGKITSGVETLNLADQQRGSR